MEVVDVALVEVEDEGVQVLPVGSVIPSLELFIFFVSPELVQFLQLAPGSENL